MTHVSLSFAGDVIPARRLVPATASNRAVYDIVTNADVSLCNFEIPLSSKGRPIEKLLNIRADPAIIGDVHVLGFDIATVANNHAVDFGWEALEDTISGLRRAGLKVVGGGATIEEARRPVIAITRGVRVGVAAFSCLLPPGMAASSERPGISPIHIDTAYEVDPYYQMEEPGDLSAIKVRTRVRQRDLEEAIEVVSKLRSECDILVVTVHWGFGSGDVLAEYQTALGMALIDSGADVVHGHHPHAVHPVGFHRGKPILFGLGTFIGQQTFLDAPTRVKDLWAEMSPDGIVARLEIASDGEISLSALPTTLDHNRLPVVARGEVFHRIRDRLERLSLPYGATVYQDGDLLRIRQREVLSWPKDN